MFGEPFTLSGTKELLLTEVPGYLFNKLREKLMEYTQDTNLTVIYDGDTLLVM